MFGMTDALIEEEEAREKAVQLLFDVATGKKGVEAVREWLLQNYPDLCYVEVKKPVEKIPIWERKAQ